MKAVANIVEPEEVIKCLTVRYLISHTTTTGYRNLYNSHDHNELQNLPIAHCEMRSAFWPTYRSEVVGGLC